MKKCGTLLTELNKYDRELRINNYEEGLCQGRQGWDLNRIVNEVCRMLSVDPDDLHKKGRANDLSSAKDLICYLG
jgi:chromosomal replication initiation ATPase DnaA